MKETRFIEQNSQKWRELDELLKARQQDPDKLSELFIKLTDDLSYARTFYPRRSVRVFLNNQAQRIFSSIYRNRRLTGSRFAGFWKEDLPQVIWLSRRELLLSLVLTLFFIGVGVFSSIHDNDFARVILGDHYVRMTEANIEAGDPMAVYKGEEESWMFLRITFNNLRVDLLTFILGVLFGIGSIGILLYNGVMIGAFQYFFIERGLFWPSFLTIFQHGTLEVSAMIISGAAGLALGRGLLFPGTYTRVQAFQFGAIRALKLFAGIIPVTIMAGFIEGFITRHTDVPDPVRILVIIFSLAFIIFYYVILPRRMAARGFKKPILPPELRPTRQSPLSAFRVRNTGEIFADTFRLLRRYLMPALLQSALVAFLLTATFYAGGSLFESMDFRGSRALFEPEGFLRILGSIASNIMHSISFDIWPEAAVMIGLIFTFTMMFSLWWGQREIALQDPEAGNASRPWYFIRRQGWKVFFITAIFMGTGFLPDFYGRFLFFMLLPVYLIWTTVSVIGDSNIYNGLLRTFHYIAHRIGRIYLLYLILFLLSVMLFTVVGSPLTFLYFEFLSTILPESVMRNNLVFDLGYVFLIFLILNLTLLLLATANIFLYYTFREISEAVSLRRRIREFSAAR